MVDRCAGGAGEYEIATIIMDVAATQPRGRQTGLNQIWCFLGGDAGDLHGGDVCYDKNHIPVLFDFDSSGYGWRALDVGVFPASDDWMDITSKAEDRRQRQLAAFVDGYSNVRQLTEHELSAVQVTPPIRHIFLMGHVLHCTGTWEGAHWANDHFIDWHMTWFRLWAEREL